MILQDNIEILCKKGNTKIIRNIFGDVEIGKVYIIPIEKLSIDSHYKISVQCDICNTQSYKPYRQYLISCKNENFYCCSPACAQVKNKKTNIEKYGHENVFQSSDIKDKIVETNNKKYGVDYPSQSEEIRKKIIKSNINNFGVDNPGKCIKFKEKMKETCLERYGVDNFSKSEKYSQNRINNGTKISDECRTEFELYQYNVRKLTSMKKNKVLENWNGLDYYDNEYIRDNFYLKYYNIFYPTIDHKISIFFGFNNNISFEDIADINNLCVTKRNINSSKNIKNEEDFKIDKKN